jgi:hypothetical protein
MLILQMPIHPHGQNAAAITARLTRRDSQRRRSLASALWSLEGSLVRVAAFVALQVTSLQPVWRAPIPPSWIKAAYKRFLELLELEVVFAAGVFGPF